jgi:hypothetical protein
VRWQRLIGAVAPALLLVPLAAAPVQAAGAPPNDKPGGAITLHVGDKVTQDTTTATTDDQDATLNESCGAPTTNASVWYKFTTRRDRNLLLDMRASDYSGGFLVFQGAPTPDSLVTCGETAVGLRAAAGTTYTVMVISDTDTVGGNLVLSLRRPPPPPKMKVSLAPRGLAYKGGAARLHGTYSCRHARGDSGIFGKVSQRVGRMKIPARFTHAVLCNGKKHHWSARAVSQTGVYDRGPAHVRLGGFACGMFSCVAIGSSPIRIHLVRAAGRDQHPARSQTSVPVHPRPLVDDMSHWGSGGVPPAKHWDS